MRKFVLSTLVVVGLTACKSTTTTPSNETTTVAETTQPTVTSKNIPINPDVTTGKLSNGLTYYIQNNGKPADKVELRLVVNVGSIVEDDDQQGLAHFMEHMNFNGTKNFKKNELVDYLQSIGVKFGAHLNAYTGFDQTVYILPIPSDDPEKLEKGFQIIEDWAFNAVLTDEEINKERGVVLEEYRTRLGAEDRMMREFLPITLHKSRYAERLPIGIKEIIENFKPEVIRRFHKDWYRPDLMAVIAVGDVDVATLEAKIKSHFSGYKNPESPREREQYFVENHDETFVAIAADEEAMFSNVQLLYKSQENTKPITTKKQYRQQFVASLFSRMLNNRLSEIQNEPNPPFTFAYAFHGPTWAPTKPAYQLNAMTGPDTQFEALKTLVKANERVKRYGFLQSELDRAKKDVLKQFEAQYNEKDKQLSKRLVQPLLNNFTVQAPMPGITWKYNFVQQTLPGITLEEVNALIYKYLNDKNRVVLLKGKKKVVTEIAIRDLLANIATDKTITPYIDEGASSVLMTQLPAKGKVTNETANASLGTTTFELSNGAKVTIKPTEFKSDQILFSCYSYGGKSLIPTSDFKKIDLALSAVPSAGVNGLNQNQLQKALAGKQIQLRPYISDLSEGMQGSCSPNDLEMFMQLLYSNFTGMNKDEKAYQSFASKQKGFLATVLANPMTYYSNEFDKFQHQDNPRYRGIPAASDFDAMDYNLAHAIYSERFSNAGDFHFFFVGNIDKATVKPLLEQYIASLPSISQKENHKDLGYRPYAKSATKIYKKGNDPKSYVKMIYRGETNYTELEDIAFHAFGEILNIKLTEKLREAEAGVYSSRVSAFLLERGYDAYNMTISYMCGPENVDKLKALTLKEVNNIVQQGPTEEDLNKHKEAVLLELKEQIKTNNYWLSQITEASFNERSVTPIEKYQAMVKSLTTKDIQKIGKKYLDRAPLIGILMPENL